MTDTRKMKTFLATWFMISGISAYSYRRILNGNSVSEMISRQPNGILDNKADPICQNGLNYDRICCNRSCGVCGGAGCGGRPGGRMNCCIFNIAISKRKCNENSAPCIMDVEAAKLSKQKLNVMRHKPKIVKKVKSTKKAARKLKKKKIIRKIKKEDFKKYFPIRMRKGQVRPLYMSYAVQEDYVPIIGYHRIGGPPSSIRTTVQRFNEQVEYLTNVARCNWITMETLSGYIKRKAKVPTRACVMTFDDGIANQYHNTLCTLNKYKIPATYYLPTYLIGSNTYYMSWNEVEKLNRIGHDIEAHTLTHAHLARMNMNQQKKEIIGCKKQLEQKGYSIKTFAYPYGEYNNDTISILESSDYILARDTRVDGTWREPKALIVSSNKTHLLHFFYIRPEYENATQLWNRIKYTGWMQFEDNYIATKGNNETVQTVRGRCSLSHGFLNMSIDTEISSQFLTKYSGGFTLFLIASTTTTTTIDPKFRVKVDGNQYKVHTSRMAFKIRSTKYYKFYINIKRLSPGVHSLSAENIGNKELLLDRFRLFSNVKQDFFERSYYKTCNPKEDEYCECK